MTKQLTTVIKWIGLSILILIGITLFILVLGMIVMLIGLFAGLLM